MDTKCESVGLRRGAGEWLTPPQCARRIGKSNQYVYDMIYSGKLPAKYSNSREIRVNEWDLHDFVKSEWKDVA